MPRRTRTTKNLAQRIDRDYFKRIFPIARWRRLLTIVFTVAGVSWLAWHAMAGNPEVYTSGPIKSSHAVFGQNCVACHATKNTFSAKVTDQSCQSCHDGPVHQAQQTFTPECASCHVEHTGQTSLSRVSDTGCTQCHSDLKTKSGALRFAANIKSFENGHPEFAVMRPGARDASTIKFNHQVHLKKELKGPRGSNVQMQCADCHQSAGIKRVLPYGEPDPSAPQTVQASYGPHSSPRAHMAPVNYMEHCSGCHTLGFDARFSDAVPHKKPEVVRDAVFKKFTEYIALHPNEIHTVNLDQRIPRRPPMPPPRNGTEWVAQMMMEAEQLLWNKTCKECHRLKFAAAVKVPEVPKAAINARWMQNARFDHQAHRLVSCESCHTKAATSTETSDILLPSIKSCQECHRPGRENSAEARCFECHDYHDWSKEKPVNGKFSIHQLIWQK
jgi:hypothetical protein